MRFDYSQQDLYAPSRSEIQASYSKIKELKVKGHFCKNLQKITCDIWDT